MLQQRISNGETLLHYGYSDPLPAYQEFSRNQDSEFGT